MMDFFDCNCVVGRRTIYFEGTAFRKRDIMETMRSLGIGRSLATSSLCLDYNAMAGNRRILEETRGEQGLYPVWSVLPGFGNDFLAEEALMREMKANGVLAARMSPSEEYFNHSLNEIVSGDLLRELEDRSIPVLFDYFPKLFDEVVRMLENHPKLVVVFMNTGYRVNRQLYPLLRKYPGVHLETSGFKQFQGIEAIVRRFGAERLIFGTGLPMFSAGAALTMVTHAAIRDEDKEKIAHRNLEALLEGARL